MKRVSVLLLALACSAAGLVASPAPASRAADNRCSAQQRKAEIQDATVVAVIDFRISPYHWDFAADKMPQAKRGCGLPLTKPPHKWLDGFPKPGKAFDSYNKLDLSLEHKNPDTPITALDSKDAAKWDKVKGSTPKDLNYYWMPQTKVIGALEFGSQKLHGDTGQHGVGTTSVSVGNIHGTCPECLLMFIDIDGASTTEGEAAIDWAMKQPWIDAITNSYGYSIAVRDRVYSGSSTGLQRSASTRGQTVFFSAGNGQDGAYVAPNSTLFSSQEGPDWIVTVGAISPRTHGSYQGHGKPADIASLGGDYPAAYGAATVSGTGSGGFGGTSNATPTIAGIYSRALYKARRELGGASRVQNDGLIARGRKVNCGKSRPKCELRDGKLTVSELRERLFHGAVHTSAGTTDPLGLTAPPAIGEEEFLAEGHGSYFGLETGKRSDYDSEFRRILGPLLGKDKALERPAGEKAWMIVDSFCRQRIWGAWKGGYFVPGKTKLPGADPAYPVRSSMEQACPNLEPPG